MSLLMDALRKAEESKKKAASSTDSSPAEPAAPDSNSDLVAKPESSESVPVSNEQEAELSADAAAIEEKSSFKDTELDFGASEDSGKTDDPAHGQEQEHKAEPQPYQEPEQEAAPPDAGDSDVAIDFELAPKEKTEPRQVLEVPEQDDLDAQESIEEVLATEPGQAATIEPEENKDEYAEEQTEENREEEKEIEKDNKETQEYGVLAPVPKPKRAAQIQSTIPENESRKGVLGTQVLGNRQRSEIRERTAGSRSSAKSVFAAKHSTPAQRQRQAIMAGGAVLIVCAVGYSAYLFLSTGSNSGITLPDNYVARDIPLESSGEIDRTGNTGGNNGTDINQGTASETNLAPTPVQETTVFATDASLPIDRNNEPVQEDNQEQAAGLAADQVEAIAEAEPVVASNNANTSVTDSAADTAASRNAAVQSVSFATEEATQNQEPESVISFSRRQSVSSTQPLLDDAYAAYQQGDLLRSRQAYQAVLNESPMHRDALLGLASIAISEGQPGMAMDYYSRLLARNPADPVARAGLLDLSPAGGPAAQERELRRLQELHPGVAALAYGLGNFYASRQQWTDAQQYYFRALQLAKTNARAPGEVNPDYAYNLAVSLEHLNQARSALSFYREALEQAGQYPAGFDQAGVRRRIESISRTLSP